VPDQPTILVAEDREDDILLIYKAFAQANIPNPLQIVRNGDEAISYLKGEGRYADRSEHPLPVLLLLDLKMPGKDGFEVLRWLRQEPTLSALRVVVLTLSTDIRDVNLAYQLGANSFLVKPLDFQDFVELSKYLMQHWLVMTKAPEISAPAATAPTAEIILPPPPPTTQPGQSPPLG